MGYLVGVDIGGTAVKMGLFDKEPDKFITIWSISTNLDDNGSHILDEINLSIRACLKDNNIGVDEVEGVGIGVPGPVDESGTVLKCVNLGWGYVNLAQDFGRLFPAKVKAGNDANVAALGEYWKGGGKNCESLAMMTLGTGVGGGIIVKGEIVTGAVGAAGEIGHFNINREEAETCGCGNKGCLEQYASATGIVNEARKVLLKVSEPTKLKDLGEITAKDIFDLARQGDRISRYLVENLADKLGLAASYICCATNPDAVIIGGGVAKAGGILIEAISRAFMKYAFHAHRDTVFRLAELGNDAGIYGAIKMVLN